MTLEEVTQAVAAQVEKALPPGVELVPGPPAEGDPGPRCYLTARKTGIQRTLGGRYICRMAYDVTYRRPPGESGLEGSYPMFLDALEDLLDAIPFPAGAPKTVLHTTGRTRAWDGSAAKAGLELSLRLSRAPEPQTAMGTLQMNREVPDETKTKQALSQRGL